jgi:hypothetical protein
LVVVVLIFINSSRKQPNTEGFWVELATRCQEVYSEEMCICTMKKYREKFKGKEQQFLYEVGNTTLLDDIYNLCENDSRKP